MAVTSRYLVLVALCTGAALGFMTPLDASGVAGTRVDAPVLKRIASRINDQAGVITIEASVPVPYVASQPDPRTFVVELRDVVVGGFTDQVTLDPRHPVAAVQVESSRAAGGVDVARVRMALTHPMRPRVRSDRNTIHVEMDRIGPAAMTRDTEFPSASVVSLTGPSPVIRDVRVSRHGEAIAVTLHGTARLVATKIDEPKEGPRRLVIDLPNVTSAVPAVSVVGQGPVQQVRIGLSRAAPLTTQVTMDLSREAPYYLESSSDGHDLTVVFDQPPADPVAAFLTGTGSSAPPAADVPMPARLVPRTPMQSRGPPVQALPPVTTPPPPQLSVTPAAHPPVPTAEVRFTGHPVSLDFQGADLRAVLRTFAEISGLNIVIDPTIQGSVDVALRDVPWDQALDIILRANRLGYVVDGTIVRIAPLAALASEEEERRKLAEAQALAGELRVLTRALSYARAEDLGTLLTQTVLSQRGTVQMDPRTNTIIINDLPERLARASDLLATLDQPEPQVEIEARIVQTNRDFARQIGVQWNFNSRVGNLDQGDPVQANGQGTTLLPVLGEIPASILDVGLTGKVDLDVQLSALERQGQGRILSTPRVSTQNNIQAEITQGIQIPIQTIANNTVTVTFKDAALTLLVTPQITAANTVIMQISVENASPDFSRQVGGIPPIDTQRANTKVLVGDGETTVIGGIYVSREQATQNRTPGLHRVPLLGWLFKRDDLRDESRELLIFLTPRIIRR
jgi:type IV pilus assembly protein PilQ